MNTQEAFNKACEHLISQGYRCTTGAEGGGDCLYRGPNGGMCAIGCLIPDDEYRPDMEELPVSLIQAKHNISTLEDVTPSVLLSLQYIHDKVPPKQWKKELTKLGLKHGLELPDCLTED